MTVTAQKAELCASFLKNFFTPEAKYNTTGILIHPYYIGYIMNKLKFTVLMLNHSFLC